MRPAIDVTQADREAAAAAYAREHCVPMDCLICQAILTGEEDCQEIVQRFARHRQSAADYWYRQGKDDGHEAAVRAMVKWLQSDAWDGVVIEHAVDAIEAGEPFK